MLATLVWNKIFDPILHTFYASERQESQDKNCMFSIKLKALKMHPKYIALWYKKYSHSSLEKITFIASCWVITSLSLGRNFRNFDIKVSSMV
jgi:hypothetical protein